MKIGSDCHLNLTLNFIVIKFKEKELALSMSI